MTITVWDGATEREAAYALWDGTTEHDLTSLGIVPYGYQVIASMLNDSPFYIAHRGGSINWPEMSLYAYSQAVAWGCPALELSAARTSDGVWIGLHDADLNRTSGLADGTLPPVSAMTWAQVQTYQNTAGPGPAQPYARVDEIFATYAGSHLFFIDVKYANAFRSEMFALIKQYPGWDRHVMKAFWDSTSFALGARAAGFRTWGYYYQNDAPQIGESHVNWDLLGMDYSANASAWTLALAPGKPVIGHICPSAAAATTALSKGATGLMCSGVTQIVPHTGP